MTRSMHLAGWSLIAIVSFGLIQAVVHAQNTERAKPKHAIKDVMRGAHLPPEGGGKSLRDRVLEGNASAEDKQQLLDLYISLVENEPPRGDATEFHKKTGLVVLAASKVLVGREGADEELRNATNCAACHKDHKPPQQ